MILTTKLNQIRINKNAILKLSNKLLKTIGKLDISNTKLIFGNNYNIPKILI